MRLPRSPGQGGSSMPGSCFPNFTHWTMRVAAMGVPPLNSVAREKCEAALYRKSEARVLISALGSHGERPALLLLRKNEKTCGADEQRQQPISDVAGAGAQKDVHPSEERDGRGQ